MLKFRSYIKSLAETKEGKEPVLSIPFPTLQSFKEIIISKKPHIPSVPEIKLNNSFFKLQNFWALSHILTLVGTSLYLFAIISKNEPLWKFCYKLSILGSIVTYAVVLYRSNFSIEQEIVELDETKTLMELVVETHRIPISDLLKNENAQLLGYALLWLVTPESFIKLLPFFIYSLINITTYLTTQIIPESALAAAVTPLLNYLEIPMLIGASHLDLVVFIVMLKQACISGSGYALFIYGFIWILRFESSEACRSSLNLCVKTCDELFSSEKSQYSHIWDRVRFILNIMVPLEKKVEKQSEETLITRDEDSDSD